MRSLTSLAAVLLGQHLILIQAAFVSPFAVCTIYRRGCEQLLSSKHTMTMSPFVPLLSSTVLSAREIRSSESSYQEEQEKERRARDMSSSEASSNEPIIFVDDDLSGGRNAVIQPGGRGQHFAPPTTLPQRFPTTLSATSQSRDMKSSESFSSRARQAGGQTPPPVKRSGREIKSSESFNQDVQEEVDNNHFIIKDQANDEASDAGVTEGNSAYVDSLLSNLEDALEKYKLTQRTNFQQQAYSILELIELYTLDVQMVAKARDMITKAGLELGKPAPLKVMAKEPVKSDHSDSNLPFGKLDDKSAWTEAEARRQWKELQELQASASPSADTFPSNHGREDNGSNENPKDITANTQQDHGQNTPSSYSIEQEQNKKPIGDKIRDRSDSMIKASTLVAEFIAKAGGASDFNGKTLGIGGLDDVLAQVKRRVWIPLAAPPLLLGELGIQPVRGLLLYGKSGNGKSLLAKILGKMLSPLRPITYLSGPDVMDMSVGSNEPKLRRILDNPPDIYDHYKSMEYAEAITKAALHVVILDEIDAIARSGRGSGHQGNARVTGDSVVNQLLAKMDGVDPFLIPTLVIGLTNQRNLVDSALLRPGRFEVQIEVPAPRTNDQRISILDIHLRLMHKKGRLLLRDAPLGSAAFQKADDKLPTYRELLNKIAKKCEGFSGAQLASVARAAASHALERSVNEFAHASAQHDISTLMNCIVKPEDFDAAMKDIQDGSISSALEDFKTEDKNTSL